MSIIENKINELRSLAILQLDTGICSSGGLRKQQIESAIDNIIKAAVLSSKYINDKLDGSIPEGMTGTEIYFK